MSPSWARLGSAQLGFSSSWSLSCLAQLGSAHEVFGPACLVNIGWNELAAFQNSELQQNVINSEQNICSYLNIMWFVLKKRSTFIYSHVFWQFYTTHFVVKSKICRLCKIDTACIQLVFWSQPARLGSACKIPSSARLAKSQLELITNKQHIQQLIKPYFKIEKVYAIDWRILWL